MLEVRGTSRTRRDDRDRDRVEGVNGGQREGGPGPGGRGKEDTVVDAVYPAMGETHFVHRSGI